MRYRVAADTSLGVLFTDLQTRGDGILVTDRIVEAVARAQRLPPQEVYELVSVIDEQGRALILPDSPHWRAALHREPTA